MKLLQKILLSLILMINFGTYAQEFDVNLQIRPRYEFRNGYRSFIPYGVAPSEFISQRTRLSLNYKQDKFVTRVAMQNVRVWGDVPTVTKTDVNGIELFEAWAQYNFDEHWRVRLGRQAIYYDNQRIIAQSDWSQSGQSQDAALLTFQNKKNQLDIGYSYSALSESDIVAQYSVSNYKSMQFAWYHTQLKKVDVSLLFLNAGYEEALPKPIPDPLPELKQNYMQTFGTYISSVSKKWNATFAMYGQTGKYEKNTVSAWYAWGTLGYNFTDHINATLGYEFLSGKGQDNSSTMIKSFYPKNGANHAFNGNMDYFYVSNYQNSAGLKDYFLKLNYLTGKWDALLTSHVFYAGNTVLDASKNKLNPYYGVEEDFIVKYAAQKNITLSAGYSQIFGTNTLQTIKTGDIDHPNNWAWALVSFAPQLFSTKK
jgi:hypothetical protein